MSRKVIITCAVTGAIHTPSMSKALPVTPEEIADAAISAAEAGAAIVHLHARNPKTGQPDQSPEATARAWICPVYWPRARCWPNPCRKKRCAAAWRRRAFRRHFEPVCKGKGGARRKAAAPQGRGGCHRGSGGSGEIRTHERLPVAGFQDRCNRPLCHASG